VVGGHVQPITDENNTIRHLLNLPLGASEEDIARAVAQFQRDTLHQRPDCQLGPATWSQLVRRGAIATPRFKPESWKVFAGGREIGVIEKTRAYTTHQNAAMAGVDLEFGFRVTDMAAVRRAGFVDGAGDPVFRWIQIIEIRTLLGTANPATFGLPANTENVVQQLRRRGRGSIIDPTTVLVPLLDDDPYFWDEVEVDPAHPDILNDNNIHRRATNGLCYDLLFWDGPNMPLAAARPGLRAYFNFETALVGVAGAHHNVLLNTVRWGFDIIRTGATVKLGVNPMHAGPLGGSPAMRHVISQEIAAGSFGGHCFAGSGFSRAATCA
jgi:hypothetical protein